MGVSGAAKFERELPQGSGNGLEATLTRIREASRSRASDSPCQARARSPNSLARRRSDCGVRAGGVCWLEVGMFR